MKIYDWFYERGMKGDIGIGTYLLFIIIVLVFLFGIFLLIHLQLVDMIEAEAEVSIQKILSIKADEDGYVVSLNDGIYFSQEQTLYELINKNGKKIYYAPYNGRIIQNNISNRIKVYCKKGDVLLKIYDISDTILRIPISGKISASLVGKSFVSSYHGKVFHGCLEGTILFESQDQAIAYLYSHDVPQKAEPGEKILTKIIKGKKKYFDQD